MSLSQTSMFSAEEAGRSPQLPNWAGPGSLWSGRRVRGCWTEPPTRECLLVDRPPTAGVDAKVWTDLERWGQRTHSMESLGKALKYRVGPQNLNLPETILLPLVTDLFMAGTWTLICMPVFTGVIYVSNSTLSSLRKERYSDTCSNVDKTEGHYTRWQKQSPPKQILLGSPSMRHLEWSDP